ncbi:hypothetical protein [Vibrio harveyi]|uniref:hypothetical protein n=1 Tax=Vibrio harveyi TaxID=669 RepID=UPI000D479199|nr:hypothetical protein [Vibrio harveyi]POB71461.1 hypothetical protein CRN59_03965 [Vibrio vulnificus]MCQ9076706.1 hypothetical protein [Vibrio harveyi]HAU8272503.1 hypothetical protein [Vibrio vulnificus]HDM8150578.1 hypothetical protein [Vibrio harveyi]HDM8193821.1 hypothetical protein [Vibrio harveyi]
MTYKSKAYEDRTDIEKIQSNWKKLSGLYQRKEWSSSVVRAATAAEIAANLVVREELENQKGIDTPFVNHLMIWANGIQGKYQKLIMASVKGKPQEESFKALSSKIGKVNKRRNQIVHGGHFDNSDTAHEVIMEAKELIQVLVGYYTPGFELDDIPLIEE